MHSISFVGNAPLAPMSMPSEVFACPEYEEVWKGLPAQAEGRKCVFCNNPPLKVLAHAIHNDNFRCRELNGGFTLQNLNTILYSLVGVWACGSGGEPYFVRCVNGLPGAQSG